MPRRPRKQRCRCGRDMNPGRETCWICTAQRARRRCERCERFANNGNALCHICRGRDRRKPEWIDLALTKHGIELRKRREAAGLSRGELAKMAGVHLRTVENVERGWTDGAPETLAKISVALLRAPAVCQARDCTIHITHPGARWCRIHEPRFEGEHALHMYAQQRTEVA
jgi:DNA-binding XRE family transcriptional regulator